jgi:hypothetical protein
LTHADLLSALAVQRESPNAARRSTDLVKQTHGDLLIGSGYIVILSKRQKAADIVTVVVSTELLERQFLVAKALPHYRQAACAATTADEDSG